MPETNFNPVSLIRKKRDGKSLSDQEIQFLVKRYSSDEIPDYQMSAFLMASYLQGLDEAEATSLTEAMLHSGIVLDLSDIPGRKVDKHSTGGVGDKLSLILAPIVASYGIPVPMISGRGLGHTGGTLDKLESIPGFRVDMDLKRYREILQKHGMVMAGQTEEIAPADKRLYALRDVTATVESIPLIAGSIMSKKLAEGIDALVLDVKYGSGAFMKTREEAGKLAQTLVHIGERAGKQTIAWLTSMEQPLGYRVGNWLEVVESVEALQGKGPEDVMKVTHLLAGTMLFMGGKAPSVQEGVQLSKQAVDDRTAFDKWLKLVEEQGGDPEYLLHPEKYEKPEHTFEFKASEEGYIARIDAYAVGMASLELGAGRRKKEDRINPVAGITLRKKVGSAVKKGETIALGFTNNKHTEKTARALMKEAIIIDSRQPDPIPLIGNKIDKAGIHEYEHF
ncbi:MAG: thymidine phosphorylase [Balneolaceae bacterium]